jgi:hypothetical protein
MGYGPNASPIMAKPEAPPIGGRRVPMKTKTQAPSVKTVNPDHMVKVVLECPLRDITIRTATNGSKYVNLPYSMRGECIGLKNVAVVLKQGKLTLALGATTTATASKTVDPELAALID